MNSKELLVWFLFSSYFLLDMFILFFLTGILQPHIHYLLVLATSVDVVILGLSFPKGQTGELRIYLLMCLFLSNNG